ncbi:MAG: hemagglutinin/hemolysin-like protein, partial [bacterium]
SVLVQVTSVNDAPVAVADSFGYSVTDLREGTATARVSVTVRPVNDAPVAVADSSSTAEDTPVSITVLANDYDVDGDSLTLSAPSMTAQGGTVAVQGAAFLYNPPAGYFGLDTFLYTASDGALSASATVTIRVDSVNDAPVAVADSTATAEDTAVLVAVLANDYDLDGETLTVTAAGPLSVQGGTVTILGAQVRYDPPANFYGTDSFLYSVTDGTTTASAQVSILVASVNDAPVALADEASTAEDTPVSIGVLANDYDVDAASLTLTAPALSAQGGALAVQGSVLLYSPRAGFFGTDTITYTISDGVLAASTSVLVQVTSVNDAPVAVADSPGPSRRPAAP